jgi:hypothetical protein
MRAAALLLATIFACSAAFAADESVSPYIDNLKEGLAPPSTESHIEALQKQQRDRGEVNEGYEGYVEELRRTDGEASQPAQSFIEAEKKKLTPKSSDGAIAAVHEGRSSLKARIEGEINHAIGFRYGVSPTRSISAEAGTQLRDFDSVYGSKYAPELALFYEYQPFHSEWLGNVGIFGSAGVGFFRGNGSFKIQLTNPVTGNPFPVQSNTSFTFVEIPVTVGLNYRFNLARILRPFVMAGPTLIGYIESRDDQVSGNRGTSRGLLVVGGVSIFLNWLAPGSTWDLYAQHGVKHYYLTIDYSRLTTFQGAVDFQVSGLSAGLTYEF